MGYIEILLKMKTSYVQMTCNFIPDALELSFVLQIPIDVIPLRGGVAM